VYVRITIVQPYVFVVQHRPRYPHLGRLTGNQRTVAYRCPECQHAWTETEWVPRLMMQPEPPSSTPRFFQK
jgi:hypothetical protein